VGRGGWWDDSVFTQFFQTLAQSILSSETPALFLFVEFSWRRVGLGAWKRWWRTGFWELVIWDTWWCGVGYAGGIVNLAVGVGVTACARLNRGGGDDNGRRIG